MGGVIFGVLKKSSNFVRFLCFSLFDACEHAILYIDAEMNEKKIYIVPSTSVVTMSVDTPVMVTMTLYTGSPFTTLETVTTDGPGLGTSIGEW